MAEDNNNRAGSCRRNTAGIFIPLNLWVNDQYSIIEKILIIEIQRNEQVKNHDLAVLIQASESLVTKTIKKLTGEGILSYVGKGEDRKLQPSAKFLHGLFKSNGFQGVWIPISLWDSQLIPPVLKFLLLEIAQLDHGDGCKENNDYFAKFLKVSSSQASRLISQLSQLKLITTKTVQAGRKAYLNSDLSVFFNSDIQTHIKHIQTPCAKGKRALIAPIFDALFNEFWELYPNKNLGDLRPREKYHEVLSHGVKHDDVMSKLSYMTLSSHWSNGRVPLATAWLSQEFL